MKSKKGRKHSKGSGGTFSRKILEIYIDRPNEAMNFKQVAGRMGITDKSSRELVMKCVEELFASGALTEHKRGKYKINPEHLGHSVRRDNIITGRVDMKPSGKAFIISSETKEDVFISVGNTNRALDGDKVKVLLYPQRKGHKTEGQIIEILERVRESFAGILQIGKYYSIFVPDSTSMPFDIMIPNDHLGGAKNGDKVIVKLTDWPERAGNPNGEVTDVLGQPGINEVEMQSILVEFGFPLKFPANVEKEASKINLPISKEEIKKRRDYRNVFTLTIDPEDAKDYDDALSLRRLDNGNWEAGVHIADVSYYVKPGSLIDQEGFNRATSVYLVDRTIPMLPEVLSNQVCSLRPQEDKLCFAAIFEMDDNAKIVSEWFGKTVINSNYRFNYDEAQNILESKTGPFAAELLKLKELATLLREERFRKGSIAFETEEVKFRLDEKGRPLSAFIKEYKDSNKLIEDFMLLANRRVAEFVSKLKQENSVKTFVYRIHDSPNPEKLTQFTEFIFKLGYNLKTSSRKGLAQSFNNLFTEIRGKGEENLISNLAIRTMAKAIYSTDNIGHYGLGFKYYTHFTSPIRRYPDLMVHRMLQDYLDHKPSYNKEEYESNCKHSSEMERKATEAERASIKYKQAEYMLDKVGQEFEGLISGISKWGIYVELTETKCEGMVSLKDMTDDYYYVDEDNYVAIGQSRGKQYRLGDKVTIKVKRIDLSKKTMDFMFLK
jgi:ribonuclease R